MRLLRRPKAFDEGGVFGALQAFLNDGEDAREVAGDEGGWVEPEAWEDGAAEPAVGIRSEPFKGLVAQDEPIDDLVEDAPDDVFADLVPAIDLEFRAQVEAHAAGGDLAHPF